MISHFESARHTKPAKEISLDEFVNDIRTGKYRKQIENLRAAKSDAKRYETLKKRLPAVTLSGTFERRRIDALKAHSGLIQIDIDGKDNSGYDPVALKKKLVNDPHLVSAIHGETIVFLFRFARCRSSWLAMGGDRCQAARPIRAERQSVGCAIQWLFEDALPACHPYVPAEPAFSSAPPTRHGRMAFPEVDVFAPCEKNE